MCSERSVWQCPLKKILVWKWNFFPGDSRFLDLLLVRHRCDAHFQENVHDGSPTTSALGVLCVTDSYRATGLWKLWMCRV